MEAMNEQKDLSKISYFMTNGNNKNVDSDFLGEKVTVEEVKEFSKSLKAEIILVRGGLRLGAKLNTEEMWDKNLMECQSAYEDNFIEGIANDIYYVSESASNGKNKKYIYDVTSDIVFKIDDTRIGSYTVHSLEYAKLVLDGIGSEAGGIYFESEEMASEDGTKCYEPDFNGFSFSTEIVYYSADFSKTSTTTIKEYLETERPKTKNVNGETYTFADYSTTKKSYGNVKCIANSIESYWVWIPRYAYKLDQTNKVSEIAFITTDNKLMSTGQDATEEGYTVHVAFTQKENMKGIWFSKYDPTPLETLVVDRTEPETPNLSNFSSTNTKLVYYTLDGNETIEVDYTTEPSQFIERNSKKYYFYNYENKIWANVKCTNTVNGVTLDSYWVWIPRFAYKLESGTSQVILLDINNKPIDTSLGDTIPNGYTIHPAFTQGDGLKGIWFSKYDPTSTETAKIDNSEISAIDFSKFNTSILKLVYYTEDTSENIEVDYTANPSKTITQNSKTYYLYNYSGNTKIWANVKCSNNVDGVILDSYWVWIPRYAYKLESGTAVVILLDENNKPLDSATYGNTIPNGFTLHPAFSQGDGLKGIWFSKYDPTKTTIE